MEGRLKLLEDGFGVRLRESEARARATAFEELAGVVFYRNRIRSQKTQAFFKARGRKKLHIRSFLIASSPVTTRYVSCALRDAAKSLHHMTFLVVMGQISLKLLMFLRVLEAILP